MTGRNRRQYQANESKIKIICGILIVFLVAFTVLMYAGGKLRGDSYRHPEFEQNVVIGDIPEDNEYTYATGTTKYGFVFGVAQRLFLQEDQSLMVYASNPASNDVYLQYVISDQDTGDVLYKTGLIQPGEYVERLNPERKLENKQYDISITVNAFNPNTWYSAGKVEIDWVLQPW